MFDPRRMGGQAPSQGGPMGVTGPSPVANTPQSDGGFGSNVSWSSGIPGVFEQQQPQGVNKYGLGGGQDPYDALLGQKQSLQRDIMGLESAMMQARLMGRSPMDLARLQAQISEKKMALQQLSQRAQLGAQKARMMANMRGSVGVNGRGGSPNPYDMNSATMMAVLGSGGGGGGDYFGGGM